MKERLKVLLAGLMYAAVLAGLLLLQAKTIEGIINRLAANIAVLALVIPMFFLWKAYTKLKTTKETQAKETGNAGGKNQEQIREIFYEQAEHLGLSLREQEVAWLIYRGFTNLQIAEELYISEATVKKHAGHIYEKMGITGRRALQENFRKDLKKAVDSYVTS